MRVILNERKVTLKLDGGGKLALLLVGETNSVSGSIVNSEHAGTLHDIARRWRTLPSGMPLRRWLNVIVLALIWEPAFCSGHDDKPECHDTSGSSARSLSLHGLWPQPRGRAYCNVDPSLVRADKAHAWDRLPEPDMRPDTRRRLAAVMPGVQSGLQRHEWIVHGTCSGLSADAYFDRAADLAEQVNASSVPAAFANNLGRPLSADAIGAAFDQAFGPGAASRVTVLCQGGGSTRRLTELDVSLAGDVAGSAAIADLIRAAAPVPPGCPGGVVVPPES